MKKKVNIMRQLKEMKTRLSCLWGDIRKVEEPILNGLSVKAAMLALEEARADARCKAKEASESFRDQVSVLEKEIRQAERKMEDTRKAVIDSVPEVVKEFINMATRGVDYGSKGLIPVWWTPSGRFVVIRNPGYTYWASRMEGQAYGATKHYLVDTGKPWGNQRLLSMVALQEHEGRITKAMLNEWQRKAVELEASSS